MIGFLDGKIAGRTPDGCLLDVNGVGYILGCSTSTLSSLPGDGGRARLYTHLHVRDDALTLFGFATEAELRLFDSLLGVSGVGPKVALALCSSFTLEEFRRVLATDDVASISSVPGIGKKTAQRVILELKEKLSVPDLHVVGSTPDALAQARSALENLGYSPAEVRAALSEVASEATGSVEDMVKSALKALA